MNVFWVMRSENGVPSKIDTASRCRHHPAVSFEFTEARSLECGRTFCLAPTALISESMREPIWDWGELEDGNDGRSNAFSPVTEPF